MSKKIIRKMKKKRLFLVLKDALGIWKRKNLFAIKRKSKKVVITYIALLKLLRYSELLLKDWFKLVRNKIEQMIQFCLACLLKLLSLAGWPYSHLVATASVSLIISFAINKAESTSGKIVIGFSKCVFIKKLYLNLIHLANPDSTWSTLIYSGVFLIYL